MTRKQRIGAVAIVAMVIGFSAQAAGNDYPTRDLTLVVPFAAGSGTDLMARNLVAGLSKKIGRPVTVDNWAGGNGIPASMYVTRAASDGYTLLLGGNTTHSANPHLSKDIKYDPERDFTPIARLATAGVVLVVSAKSNIKSVDDLVNEARLASGKLTYGSPNAGSQIAAELIKKGKGIDIIRVPYRVTPQAMTDVIAGNISMTFLDVASALTSVRGGQLRALAITSESRAQLMPDVPTFQELGFRELVFTYWIGLFGPKDLPKEVVGVLGGAVQQVITDESMQATLRTLGLEPAVSCGHGNAGVCQD